jgi:hypothetical protein
MLFAASEFQVERGNFGCTPHIIGEPWPAEAIHAATIAPKTHARESMRLLTLLLPALFYDR